MHRAHITPLYIIMTYSFSINQAELNQQKNSDFMPKKRHIDVSSMLIIFVVTILTERLHKK